MVIPKGLTPAKDLPAAIRGPRDNRYDYQRGGEGRGENISQLRN